MRKHRLQNIVLGMLLMALVMGLAIPALAAVTTKTLNANYMDIKLAVDGTTITPTDVNGNIVEPFACDGTTYLPVRAVGEALGKEVTWDGNTNTVYIGEVPAGAIKNWVGVANPGVLGIGYNGATAKEMPNTFKAIKETHAVANGSGPTSLLLTVGSMGLEYYDIVEPYEIRIHGLEFRLGEGKINESGDRSYQIILRGMLQDIISDPSDVNSIMELIEKADQLCAIRNDMSASEEEKEAATEEFKNLFSYADDKNVTTHEHIYQLNCVNVELKEGHWPHTWADLIIKNK